MCDQIDFVVCRLCLNSGGELINIYDENNKSEFMLKKTIEDLLNVEVVEDTRYPWLVCSICMEKLTEFRLFKHRCAECLFVFHNRIRKGCNPATNDWISNREECPAELKKRYCDETITSDTIDMGPVNVPDDTIVVKEEIDTASECSGSPGRDIDSSIVPSMQEGGSHRSDNEDSGNSDCSEGEEFIPSLNVDVVIKEECEADISQGEGGLREEVSEVQDGEQGQDGVGKDGEGNFLHRCKICKEGFAQEDILKAHVLRVHVKKGRQLRSGIRSDVDKDKGGCDGDVASVVAPQKKQKTSYNDGGDPDTGVGSVVAAQKKQKISYKDESDSDKDVGSVVARGMKYVCEICSREFSQKRNLTRHMMLHTGVRPHKCGVCSKDYLSKGDLARHTLTHTGERPYKCGICAKDYLCQRDLNRHSMTHTGERPHKCALCPKTFQYKQHLEGHLLTHTGKRPHKCDECARAFTLKQQLKDHLRIHSGIKAHKCETCSKAFTFKQQLKDHLRIHAGIKAHKCETCSKSFTLKQQLKKHMAVHLSTGERPHICVLCSRSYIRKEDLKKHALKHKCETCPDGCATENCPGLRNLLDGDQRPFACDVCSKAFRHKSFLKRHLVIHNRTTQRKCDVCPMVFKDKKGLTRHMKKHLGIKQMKCSHCTFTSIYKRSLSRHLIEVHLNVKD